VKSDGESEALHGKNALNIVNWIVSM